MKQYDIKITAHANYPISDHRQVEASGFRAAIGKAIGEFLLDQGRINAKRKRKIKSINLTIQS